MVDLAAGTGKLTRQILMCTGAEVVAVEPLESMRAKFREVLPSVPVLDGTAEDIPLDSASVDAVVAGQAWHWFDSRRALSESSRVLKPVGGVALLWNEFDESVPWMKEYTHIRRKSPVSSPTRAEGEWMKAFEQERQIWTPLSSARFHHTVTTTREGAVERMLSSSVMELLPAKERELISREILAILDRHPETQGRSELEVPYWTEVYWTRKNRTDPLDPPGSGT